MTLLGRQPSHSGLHEPLVASRRDARRQFPRKSVLAVRRARRTCACRAMAGRSLATAVRGPARTPRAIGGPRCATSTRRGMIINAAARGGSTSGPDASCAVLAAPAPCPERAPCAPSRAPARFAAREQRLSAKISQIGTTARVAGRQQPLQRLAVRWLTVGRHTERGRE